MKTKLYFIVIFFFVGICVVQAQIRGQIQYSNEIVKTNKVNGFDKIDSNELTTGEPGSPELPVLLKSYLIPVDADRVTINVQNVSKQKVEGQYYIYPTQPPVTTDYMGSISPRSA